MWERRNEKSGSFILDEGAECVTFLCTKSGEDVGEDAAGKVDAVEFLPCEELYFESSLIKAGCAWIKRTFQDIAMYSRIKYQFPGEFSVFQGGLAWRMPLSQGITSLLFPELGKLSWFQVGLTCIKDTFQDIASFYSHATNLNFVANILQCDQDAI